LSLLLEVYKLDSFLRAKATKITKDKILADDVVQDLYLKLGTYDQTKLKFLIEKNLIKWVCIRMINQIFIDYKRKSREITFESVEATYEPTNEKQEKEKKIKQVEENWQNLSWFERKMARIYFGLDLEEQEILACKTNKPMSLRKISKMTGIPIRTVWETIKKVKDESRK